MRYRFVLAAVFSFVLCAGLALPGISFQAGLAQAAPVSAIDVTGNQRVEADTVRSYMQVVVGQEATAERIDSSIKALFQTGLFSDVSISQQGTRVLVRVEENPVVNKVSFEGNSEIKDDALSKETELREQVVFTRAKAQNDVQRLIALYRRSGYFAARVEPKIIRLQQNRVNLVFEISEGVSTRVARINFLGNEAFSDSQLRSVITTSESSWWKFFSTTDSYDPDRVAYDSGLLRRYYLRNGYADFRVVSSTAELAPDGKSFFITFSVDEGPRYRVGDVSVNVGQTALDAETLASVIETRKGRDYDASDVDATLEGMAVEAGKAGFAFAKIEPKLDRDPQNRILNITYNVDEGPRVYIERIDIRGNVRTLDEVIRREMLLAEGDAYNRVLVDRARRRLNALNFFQTVDFREETGSAADRVVLVVEVEEKSTGSFNVSAGYSSTEQLVAGVGIQESNLLGRGQKIDLNTMLSFKRQTVRFAFTEPYFLGRRVSAGVDAVVQRNDMKNVASFTTEQYGAGVSLGFRLDDYQSLRMRYGLTHRNLITTSSAPLAVQAQDGKSFKSSLSLSYMMDRTDNPARPTKGIRINPSVELSGLGGDVKFVSTEIETGMYYPLYDGIIFKLKGTAGAQFGWDGQDVPVVDRFYKGADSFRGFASSGIGPRQYNPSTLDTSSIGGTKYAIGTAEIMFPLGLPEEFGLSGSIFSDVGTLFDAPESGADVYDSSKLRASVGAGITWESPFGPLRFDYARPIAKADYDQTEYFRFGVGTAF